MPTLEPKKLALIRIWQILKEYSDFNHPLTQEEILEKLEKNYGIVIERKAVSRNISLLKEAGVSIDANRRGSFLDDRDFDDSELHLLIDSVLCCQHIPAKYSKELIKKLSGLSNSYFKAGVKNIYSVDEWNKTDNQALFLNIELIDEAIEKGLQIHYDYNKYGTDKKLHKSSQQYVSPYRMILHNQRYYLMAYSEYWQNIVYHRLDRITDMTITEKKAVPLRTIPGYRNGIDYQALSTGMPYMYADKAEPIEFVADEAIVDQIIDWFGKNARIQRDETQGSRVRVFVTASPNAMEHWAMQYMSHVEIISPESLRTRIRKILEKGTEKYNK